jgi:Toprim domain
MTTTKTRGRIDLDAVRAGLVERAAEVAIALLGEPNRAMSTGKQLRFGTNGSLAMERVGPKAGLWHDHQIQEGGDLLDLIARERRIDFVGALKIASDLLAMPVTEPARHVRQAPQNKPADVETPDTKEFAKAIWREAVAIEDTPAEVYLRKTRRLDIPEGTSGRVLRFHGACPFYKVEKGQKIHFKTPALVCLFRNIHTDEPVAIHRIAVTPDGRTVDFRPRKLSLGPTRLAAVKLSANGDVTTGLTIGEGVETTIAGMMLGFKPAWALCTSGAIRHFPVLAGIGALTVLVDHDDPEKSGKGAGQECARAVSQVWTSHGREVTRVTPTTAGLDINDHLRGST